MTAHKEQGFIPGMVIEINISIAILLVVVAVLMPWSTSQYKTIGVDPVQAELAVPTPAASASLPQQWAAGLGMDTRFVRLEAFATAWLVPVLIVAAAIAIFVAALHWPYWLMLAVLCATWGYGIYAGGGSQSIRIADSGSVQLRGYARFAGVFSTTLQTNVKDIESVLVHKVRPETWIIFRDGKERRAWRIYADSPAEAQAVAAVLRRSFEPPAPTKPGEREAGRAGEEKPAEQKN